MGEGERALIRGELVLNVGRQDERLFEAGVGKGGANSKTYGN